MIRILKKSGAEIVPHLDALAELRIRVFREFPYLYDGSIDYERDYLEAYSKHPDAVGVLALKADRIVGVSTGVPLAAADPEFQRPFESAGCQMSEIFYFGESVLETTERGQGIGHRFFDEREQHAAERGYPITAFCAVTRPDDHPLQPANDRPHHTFWAKRGYVRHPELAAELAWKQVDSAEESTHRLVFWIRS